MKSSRFLQDDVGMNDGISGRMSPAYNILDRFGSLGLSWMFKDHGVKTDEKLAAWNKVRRAGYTMVLKERCTFGAIRESFHQVWWV